MSDINSDKEYRDKLLALLKKEVKQIMEEAVTRKFVHEESSSVSSLCSAIDACLSHGLKRRALGLFKTNSTTALLQKVAKNYDPAAQLFRTVQEIENSDPNKRSSSSSDSTNRLKNKHNLTISGNATARASRFLWIRIALLEKLLVGIIDHLVQHAAKYYEKEALVSDPVAGQILASLLVGPCALDYSKMKTQDHFWTDPPADELVQRHRLSSPLLNGPSTPPVGRKPLGLTYRRGVTPAMDMVINGRTTSNSSEESTPRNSLHWSPRDYVESLHQNYKTTLLYGKNNVLVQPRENLEPMPGYLSLHSLPSTLAIKWTPNQLMNGCNSSLSETPPDNSSVDKSVYWDYALSVTVEEIVYLHCHQTESGGTLVLVGQDGVQRSPIRFPRGGHLLAFLSCLENGLSPFGQLEPPLWTAKGRGKVFPRLKRKARGSVRNRESKPSGADNEQPSATESSSSSTSTDPNGPNDSESEDSERDFVFRIVQNAHETMPQEMFESPKNKPSSPWSYLWNRSGSERRSRQSSSTSSNTSQMSTSTFESQDHPLAAAIKQKPSGQQPPSDVSTDKSIQTLCDSMKRQIISRAFYGWLAHCRHLRTVRTHLAGLVHSNIVDEMTPTDASGGLSRELWRSFHDSNAAIAPEHKQEIYRLIYFGGIEHGLRNEVWPYLLSHYKFGQTGEERQERDHEMQMHYETTMTEWLAVESIVRQRDKEIMVANLAKLSSESTASSDLPLGSKDHGTSVNMSNDVFTDSETEGEDEEDYADEARDELPDQKPTANHRAKGTPTKTHKASATKMRRQRQVESQGSQATIMMVTNPTFDAEASNGIEAKEDEQTDGKKLSASSPCVSPASSNGGVYSTELLDQFSLNLHRIDKDVNRCDRNFWYFAQKENLEKLRNIMCTFVWENLDECGSDATGGYVQGMCDLVAPLLVIFDDEVISYSCFNELMKHMMANFPNGGAMDSHFANMRSLIQILDSEIFELMHANGDYTHFYFCYRWFLLDFKRELVYDDVFRVWEAIWAAKHIASPNYVLFIALALVEYYRDIIIDNCMDFTNVIKFFNEMAERHDAKAILKVSRDLVLQIQTLIDNK